MKRILYLIILMAYGSLALAQTEINPKIKPDKDKQYITTPYNCWCSKARIGNLARARFQI